MKKGEESIKFGAPKKKKMAEKQDEIEQSIAFLEKNFAKVFTDDAVKQKMWSELETKKRELETIIETKQKVRYYSYSFQSTVWLSHF